jgi:hypothetical protein
MFPRIQTRAAIQFTHKNALNSANAPNALPKLFLFPGHIEVETISRFRASFNIKRLVKTTVKESQRSRHRFPPVNGKLVKPPLVASLSESKVPLAYT